MKILNIVRMISFVITLLTSIPLINSYLRDVNPKFPIFTHLHVWFGVIFIITAIISMILQKRKQNKK